ncbi:spermatogenesis-associated protein 2-like protein isoform X1 [Gopherus flavomarginatus]|uniref:spermatogenesis-associated protein 2-like protein isoform X1 n=1 Tax=Gopherus flavomarginatus TaxID=286002 RepID=UPI0021CBF424|nr:spermatogenesis-associated protein 2-like protein isoform X1 [Gopherus flavomarginatus]
MGSSSLVQQKYRKCLERDFRRGQSGVCTDLALREWLQQRLLADPELHYALRNDVFAMLTSSLQGWDALPLALRGLARAFEVLELAAVNLHLLPWRKEFSTIKLSPVLLQMVCRAEESETMEELVGSDSCLMIVESKALFGGIHHILVSLCCHYEQ